MNSSDEINAVLTNIERLCVDTLAGIPDPATPVRSRPQLRLIEGGKDAGPARPRSP